MIRAFVAAVALAAAVASVAAAAPLDARCDKRVALDGPAALRRRRRRGRPQGAADAATLPQASHGVMAGARASVIGVENGLPTLDGAPVNGTTVAAWQQEIDGRLQTLSARRPASAPGSTSSSIARPRSSACCRSSARSARATSCSSSSSPCPTRWPGTCRPGAAGGDSLPRSADRTGRRLDRAGEAVRSRGLRRRARLPDGDAAQRGQGDAASRARPPLRPPAGRHEPRLRLRPRRRRRRRVHGDRHVQRLQDPAAGVARPAGTRRAGAGAAPGSRHGTVAGHRAGSRHQARAAPPYQVFRARSDSDVTVTGGRRWREAEDPSLQTRARHLLKSRT